MYSLSSILFTTIHGYHCSGVQRGLCTPETERRKIHIMKDTRSILSLIVLFILMGGTAFAQIPRTITYQGSLNQAGSGTPVNGSVQITCTLYDALTGGTELWTEAHSSVSVEHHPRHRHAARHAGL
jgi:hypothetical protein